MATPEERDFPIGHPASCDYDPSSPAAIAWARAHYAPLGERDYPLGHVKACDTPGNTNQVVILPGVDPAHPDLEPFTGRTPAQVAALAALNRQLAADAKETAPRKPIIAPPPPEPGDITEPVGQPSDAAAPTGV